MSHQADGTGISPSDCELCSGVRLSLFRSRHSTALFVFLAPLAPNRTKMFVHSCIIFFDIFAAVAVAVAGSQWPDRKEYKLSQSDSRWPEPI